MLGHQHNRVRVKLKLLEDFVVHLLRHTMLTRLGEAGADAFTIMRIAGHSSITISQRYVHPSDDAMEAALDRFEKRRASTCARVKSANGCYSMKTQPLAPVAQLDRATDFESVGREFESLRAHQRPRV